MAKKIIVILTIIFVIVSSLNYKKIIQNFYPRQYKKYVEEYSNRYGLDPNLIYSFIKVESKFNPYAKSNRDAMGLMQITPQTGEYIAKLLGDEDYMDMKLYDPEINIRYGCFYIAKLLKSFDGDMDCVIAAYNGGEGNVRKWIKSNPKGTGLDVEKIPFSETRNYVKNIKLNYKIYKFLYEK